jgi:hypothetical protein
MNAGFQASIKYEADYRHKCKQTDQKASERSLTKFISSDAFDNGDFQGTRDDKFKAIYVGRKVSAVSFKLKKVFILRQEMMFGIKGE